MESITSEQKEYMDYLDEIYPDIPGGYGLLLFKGDRIAFNVGFNDLYTGSFLNLDKSATNPLEISPGTSDAAQIVG